METSRIIISIILFVIGLIFIFNNKNIGKGAYKFYRWFYTEKRLKIMFRIVGIFLVIISIILLFVK